MDKQLKGKTAIITGSGSGIGKAIALAFAGEGANTVINYHDDREEAEQVKEEIEKAGGKAIVVHADVSREEDVTRLFQQARQQYHSIDIVICNAGIQKDNNIADMDLAEWQRVIDVNLTGYFLCSREAIREFRNKKKETSKSATGNIIFISSVHDIIPWAGHVNYAASKGGVLMLMKSLALELGPEKIRVNAISPGAIKTDINKDVWSDEDQAKALLKLIPYGRIGEPEDVANVAVWLADTQSDYVTGTTIYVDGGMTLYPGFVNNG
jgi:glucose 1-dehydrogenase